MTEQTNSAGQGTDRKLQIAKKKSALTFAGYIAGECVFHLKTHKGGVKKCVLQQDICIVDDKKRYRLTEEQVQRFKDAEAEFLSDYNAAKRDQGGGLFVLRRTAKRVMPAVCPIGCISLSPSARTAMRCSCERASSDICIYMILSLICFSLIGGVMGGGPI